MHKYSGTMGFQRLIKAIKSGGGGGTSGPPGPDSVGTSQIINGTVGEADIADGAITEAKFSSELQTRLLDFSQSLFNLEYPGFWGTIRFTNDNRSDNGATLTITVESRYYNPVNDTTDIIQRLASTTITRNHHVDIPITIENRLTNKETMIRMYYTINKAYIENASSDFFQEDDKSSNEIGEYYAYIFDGNYDDNNGGTAEISFIVSDNI
jgi:hypothetical protein